MTVASKGPVPVHPKRFRCGDGARVAFRGVVLHTDEILDDEDYTGDAEQLARVLARDPNPLDPNGWGPSYNDIADTDGWYNAVGHACRSYSAPPCNGTRLHICIPVRINAYGTKPAMSRSDWLSDGVRPFIMVVAAYIVAMSEAYGFTIQRITAEQLSASMDKIEGYCCHWDVSRAFHQTTHTDVGPAFPWDVLADDIDEIIHGSVPPVPIPIPPEPTPEPPKPEPTPPQEVTLKDMPRLEQGSRGNAVVTLQTLLIQRGIWQDRPENRDGVFGAGTDKGVRKFQEQRGITVDGKVWDQTWGELGHA